MDYIYHITTRDDWAAAQVVGAYFNTSLDSEGFIHCSTAAQVLTVANAFYAGQPNLVLLQIVPAQLEAELKWEAPAHPEISTNSGPPPTDKQFPHVYGPVNVGAVAQVLDFPALADGTFALPQGMGGG